MFSSGCVRGCKVSWNEAKNDAGKGKRGEEGEENALSEAVEAKRGEKAEENGKIMLGR